MSQNDANKIKFEDLSSSDWWVRQISDLANWRPGGVFLVCTGPKSCIGPAEAWFYTAGGLLKDPNQVLFPEIILIVPPGTKRLDYRNRFKDGIAYSFKNAQKSVPQEISRYLDDDKWPWVENDADRLLQRLKSVSNGTAIAIAGAERLRFSKLEQQFGSSVLTHTGYRVSHSSADDLMLPHLHELLSQLLNLSQERELSIVVFAENFDFDLGNLPERLRAHPELAVISTPYDEFERARIQVTFEALRISRTADLKSAIEFIRSNISGTAHQAHAICFVCGDRGLWNEAWNSVENHMNELRALNDVGILLNLAQAAAACGEGKPSVELLMQAFNLGFETVESFNSAAAIANSVNANELLDQILAEMRVAYPNHPKATSRFFDRMMALGRHHEAAEIADAASATFEASWARLHELHVPDWEAFIKAGIETGREQEAVAKCVMYSLEMGQSDQAREFLKRIPIVEKNAAHRAALTFRIVTKEIGFSDTNADLDRLLVECHSVFRYLAVNPGDTGFRSEVSHWFESCAEDRSRLALLIGSLMHSFKQVSPQFEPANATNAVSPFDQPTSEQDFEEALSFTKAVSRTSKSCLFGQAIMPPEYSAGVTDDVMRGFGVIINANTKNPDLGSIFLILQCLNLGCRIRREIWDFQAAIQLAGGLLSSGKISEALSLAENIILFWSDGSDEFGTARRAHAWSCMADVYNRVRNPVISALYQILCFESMAAEPAQQHAILLKHKIRLTARILRDLKVPELAGVFLAAEVTLIDTFPRGKEKKEWSVTEMGCRLHLINEATPKESVEEFISNLQLLLQDEDETDWAPPVSLAISALNVLQHYGFLIPKSFRSLAEHRIPKCASGSQKLFRYFLLDVPSACELRGAVTDLINGNPQDDEGFGASVIEGLFRRAISTACNNSDPELFTLAANWLSQPALAASRTSREKSRKQSHVRLSSWTELLALGNANDSERMFDHADAIQRQVHRTQSNFINLTELPISAAKYLAGSDEALCILAQDTDNNLCRFIIRRTGFDEPKKLPKTSWNFEKYSTWTKTYPRGYSWDRRFDALGPYDIPDLTEIQESLFSLQPEVPTDTPVVTILPEADLFGFSYFLTKAQNGWVGEKTICVTAPSLSWLAAVRQLPGPNLNLKGWLGHPSSNDFAVLRPRGELKPFFATVGGIVIDSPTPREVGRSGVAVILSHGSQGPFGSFVGLNDVGQFTNEDLAEFLGECACVILFVCNAGRNDHRAFNQETFGLVGQLLRRGVRAVIAPPAPLRNDLPALWFPSFYKALQERKTIGQAYATARDRLRETFSHPCAWGALQLFGDAQLVFALES
jgi:hypothetical protein